MNLYGEINMKKKNFIGTCLIALPFLFTSNLVFSQEKKTELFKDLKVSAKGKVSSDISNVIGAGCNVGSKIFERLQKLIDATAQQPTVMDQGAFFYLFANGGMYNPSVSGELSSAISNFINIQFLPGDSKLEFKVAANFATDGELAIAPYPLKVDYSNDKRVVKFNEKVMGHDQFKKLNDNTFFSGFRCYGVSETNVTADTTFQATIGGPTTAMMCTHGTKATKTEAADKINVADVAFGNTATTPLAAAGGELAYEQKKLCPIVKGKADGTASGQAYVEAADSPTGKNCATNTRTNNSLMINAFEVGMTISKEEVVGVDGTLWISEIKFLPLKTIGGLPQFESQGAFNVFSLDGYSIDSANTVTLSSNDDDAILRDSNSNVQYDKDLIESITACAGVKRIVDAD